LFILIYELLATPTLVKVNHMFLWQFSHTCSWN